jgi:Stage II sporulation protein/FG-GAP-like repeat
VLSRRLLAATLTAVLALTTAGASVADAAAPPVRPSTTPGGLLPGGVRPAAQQDVPTCQDEHKCTIVKDTTPGDPSCSGYSSQTTPPTNIRVLVRTGGQTGTYTITDVPFEQYLDNVLPNEWEASWDSDALKAGAVAVRSYAWYWVTHYGGYVGSTKSSSTCFDVTDDSLFQNYDPGSAYSTTTAAIVATRQVAARVGGKILQTSYRSYLSNAGESCGAGATGSVMSQVGTQACIDSDENKGGSTGNKYNVILAKYYYPGLQLATPQQQRTAHDFTFEQTSTKATFAAGRWSIDDGYGTTFNFGQAGDQPVAIDDGDGFAHVAVWIPSTGYWYVASPSGQVAQRVHWGQRGDIPVAAHYSGIAEPSVFAVFVPSTHTWWLRGRASIDYGATGDVPVPGDYDGDGKTDIAVWRPSTGVWYVRSAAGATVQRVVWGRKGDIPVPADYTGDGKTDLAVYRPSTHQFLVRGQSAVHYGVAGDIPVTGDFTGDGKADCAVYDPPTHRWYVIGASTVTFGSSGATPIGSAPYRG